MKKSKHTESQIIKALKQNEQGRKAEDIYREPDHRNTGTARARDEHLLLTKRYKLLRYL